MISCTKDVLIADSLGTSRPTKWFNIIWWWLDSNPSPLVTEATALSTVPQLRPLNVILIQESHCWNSSLQLTLIKYIWCHYIFLSAPKMYWNWIGSTPVDVLRVNFTCFIEYWKSWQNAGVDAIKIKQKIILVIYLLGDGLGFVRTSTPGLFLFIFFSLIQLQNLPLTLFEPWISGIGSNRSTKRGTTTAQFVRAVLYNWSLISWEYYSHLRSL